MKNKYILLLTIVLIAAATGTFASIRAKHANNEKINTEIDKLIQQTEIDTGKKISTIDAEIHISEKDRNNTKIKDLLKSRFNVESYRIGRVATLRSMPKIIEYNDLENYLWNIREGLLDRSDFESVGLTVPEEWITYERNVETMSDEAWAIYSKKIEKMNDMANGMR